jgi:hypothetical protein
MKDDDRLLADSELGPGAHRLGQRRLPEGLAATDVECGHRPMVVRYRIVDAVVAHAVERAEAFSRPEAREAR